MTAQGEADTNPWIRVRIAAVRDSDHWNPSISVSKLPAVEVQWQSNQEFAAGIDAAYRRLHPGVLGDENDPRWHGAVDWGVRRRESDPSTATVADYVRPDLVWNVRQETGELYVTIGVLHGPYAIGDVVAASDSGYDNCDWTDIVVWKSDGGRGGDSIWYEMLSFLAQNGVTVESAAIEGSKFVAGGVVTHLARRVGMRVARKRRDREARYLVRQWESRGITPYSLRAWFDTKSEWSAVEVSNRLCVTRRSAVQLMKALGFVHRGSDVWTLGESKKARRRRAAWMKSEETDWLPEPY